MMYTQRPLAYAPTPYSYTPNPARSASINLDEVRLGYSHYVCPPLTAPQEVKLASSSAQRDLYESLAEIYSIIITLDGLEKAFIKDVVTEAEYTETCTRLLKQYKSSLGDDAVAREFDDLETFKRTWGVCLLLTSLLRSEKENPSVSILRVVADNISLVGMSPRHRTPPHRSPGDSRASHARHPHRADRAFSTGLHGRHIR